MPKLLVAHTCVGCQRLLIQLGLLQVTPGVVSPVYSDREFDYVLRKHADQLVVVCASSTDCKPCRSFEPVFDVGDFVSFHIHHYHILFLSGSALASHWEVIKQSGSSCTVRCSTSKLLSSFREQADADVSNALVVVLLQYWV